MFGKEKKIPFEADLNLISFHIQKHDINNFEKSLKNILSKYEKLEGEDKENLVPKLSSEIRKLIDEQKLKFYKLLLKYLKEYDIIDLEYFNIALEFCKLLRTFKKYDECIQQLNILNDDANNYEDPESIEDIIIQLNDLRKNVSLFKEESKEVNNKNNKNSKKNKKKNKKKFKEFDLKIEEYDEEKEKEEKDEMLRLLKNTFSLTDDEMTELLNFVEEEDYDDIDKFISILLNLFSIPEDEEDKEDKEISNSISNNEEKKEPVIKKKTKLTELLESAKNEIINNEDNITTKPEKQKTKMNLCSCLDLKRITGFLKKNGNSKKIDLHGYTLVQSMCIVEKKLESLREKMIEDNLKEITLEIVTGIGNNSPGHKAILKPKITQWLKLINRDNNFSVNSPVDEGWIMVTIY